MQWILLAVGIENPVLGAPNADFIPSESLQSGHVAHDQKYKRMGVAQRHFHKGNAVDSVGCRHRKSVIGAPNADFIPTENVQSGHVAHDQKSKRMGVAQRHFHKGNAVK